MRLASLLVPTAIASVWTVSPVQASSNSQVYVDNLVEWVRSLKGGYFSQKQEIRRNEDGSHAGIFAVERIEKGEVLFSMPWEYIITAFGQYGIPTDEPEPVPLNCHLVKNVLLEIGKGDKSAYYPYTQYLLDLPMGELPSGWSQEGEEFLTEILGDLPPTDMFSWLTDDWYGNCEGGASPLEERIALMVVQNADDDIMIPLFDMYNHRNKPWHNADSASARGKKYSLVALRTIEAGEQIHTSYNLCAGCGGRNTIYGTPELFRDYGFIEPYPQRWVFHGRKFRIDIDKQDPNNPDSALDISFYDLNKKAYIKSLRDDDINYLRGEIQRLERMGNLAWHSGATENIPEKELKAIWAYHAAILSAMKSGVVGSSGSDVEKACLDGKIVNDECVVGDTYDDLDDDKDPIDYTVSTCDINTLMKFEGYDLTFVRKTHYQLMNYQTRRSDKNVCMDLDDTIQICSNYRPHYHEYIVDFPARYVDSVKRVIFIGGGDSMILDEVLKYPELELVVGLEIDQQVTRHVFKRMHTQPHFEDDRVEWWFGDATKSLLLLPDDYASSFDLVLVDLSETVVSLTVTDELDVLEALSLLLKPEGVMVKNEFYHNKMAEVFDYTAEIHVNDVPTICGQSMILGSNKRDFFHRVPKDRELSMKLIDPISEDLDRFNLMHDYRQNNATKQGKCITRPQPELTEQTKAAGQLMIIDAEQVTIDLESADAVKDAVAKTVQDVGMTVVDSTFPSVTDNAFIVTMQEGYIMARLWKDEKYIAFDAHLWGGFGKYESLRAALISVAGSPKGSAPTYRIVVGGMFGYAGWKHDQSTMGPKLDVTSRNCDISLGAVKEPFDQDAVDTVLKYVVEEILWVDDSTSLVICGSPDEPCASRDVLEEHEEIDKVIVVNSCEGLDLTGPVDVRSSGLYTCEKIMIRKLLEQIGDHQSRISSIIVDSSATKETAKVMHGILNIPEYMKQLMHKYFIGISFMPDGGNEIWRRGFLEKIRRDDPMDPSSRAELRLTQGDKAMELGILSIGDDGFMKRLGGMVASMEDDIGIAAKTEKVQGGQWAWQHNFNPREFLPSAYDPTPALKQYEEQKPLGRGSLFQMEFKEGSREELSASLISESLFATLTAMRIRTGVIQPQKYESLEGTVMAVFYSGGSAVAVWDGRKHVGINLFSYDQDEVAATKFIDLFQKIAGSLGLTLRDDQPRGTGRVVNFQADIDHIDAPIKDDDDDEEEYFEDDE